jgi:uncharacterized protein
MRFHDERRADTLNAMIKRILLVLALSGAVAYGANEPSPGQSPAGNPPSEESIKQLLELAQTQKLIDSVMAQMDELMKQAIYQATQGREIPPTVQKNIDKRQAEIVGLMKEVLNWKKLEPMYVRVYQKTFSQQEVDGMISFYKTPPGQAVVAKMPAAMQNTMNEIQQMMGPVMEKLQRMQQDVVAEMKAQSQKKGG